MHRLPPPSALCAMLSSSCQDFDRAFPATPSNSEDAFFWPILPDCMNRVFPALRQVRVSPRWRHQGRWEYGQSAKTVILHAGWVITHHGLARLRDIEKEVYEAGCWDLGLVHAGAFPADVGLEARSEKSLAPHQFASYAGNPWPDFIVNRLSFYRDQWQASKDASLLGENAPCLPPSQPPRL